MELQNLYNQVRRPQQQWVMQQQQQQPFQFQTPHFHQQHSQFQFQQAYQQQQPQQWPSNQLQHHRSMTPPPRMSVSPPEYQWQRPNTPPTYMQQQQEPRVSTSIYPQQYQQPRAAIPPPYIGQESQQLPFNYQQWPEQPISRPRTAPEQYYDVQQRPGPSRAHTPPRPAAQRVSEAIVPDPSAIASTSASPQQVHSTLTEPVYVTLNRDVKRVANNLKQIVVFNSAQTDPVRTLRDWDLWGPFFFIIALSCILSSTASDNKSTVFAVVFAVLSAGAVSLTMNVVLLGGKLNFLQSLSVLGYCLFPMNVGAILCVVSKNKIYRTLVVLITLLWCSWSVYPFVSTAVRPSRKALAVYPVFLMYISMGFLVLANN